MKAVMALIGLVFGMNAFAASANVELTQLVNATRAQLESKIEKSVRETAGFPGPIRDLKVHWKTLKCLAAQSSEMEPAPVGACVVTASAFQVHAQVSIVVRQYEIDAYTLYTDVE